MNQNTKKLMLSKETLRQLDVTDTKKPGPAAPLS
jgi:hypothetical protein